MSSEADDAVFLAAAYGLVPDEWQEDVLGGWLGVRRNGRWAAPRCGLAVPRQNGKNAVLEIRELYGMTQRGEKFLHTAHEVKTARKAFARLLWFFDNPRKYPELCELVKEIRRTNGQEAIVLENGGSVEFIARSKGSGRGYTVDVLVLDEAQELSDDTFSALRPTISAAPLGNPQVIMTGTPPSPLMNGEVFTRTRDAGVQGKDGRLCWHEWSCVAPKHGVLDLDDPVNWAAVNPALGVRLLAETITDERADMDEGTFARERLGVWRDEEAERHLSPLARWGDWVDPDPGNAPESMRSFGVEVDLDRAFASIGAAGRRDLGDDKRVQLELVERMRGTGGVVQRCKELHESHGPAAFAVDGGGPAGDLIPDLEAVGLTVVTASLKDVVAADQGLVDAVNDGTVVYGPQPDLAAAAEGARKRMVGDGAFVLGRRASTDNVTPVKAVSLARWLCTAYEYDVLDSIY